MVLLLQFLGGQAPSGVGCPLGMHEASWWMDRAKEKKEKGKTKMAGDGKAVGVFGGSGVRVVCNIFFFSWSSLLFFSCHHLFWCIFFSPFSGVFIFLCFFYFFYFSLSPTSYVFFTSFLSLRHLICILQCYLFFSLIFSVNLKVVSLPSLQILDSFTYPDYMLPITLFLNYSLHPQLKVV